MCLVQFWPQTCWWQRWSFLIPACKISCQYILEGDIVLNETQEDVKHIFKRQKNIPQSTKGSCPHVLKSPDPKWQIPGRGTQTGLLPRLSLESIRPMVQVWKPPRLSGSPRWLLRGTAHTEGCRGRTFQDCTRVRGWLGEDKGKEREGCGWFGRNKHGTRGTAM